MSENPTKKSQGTESGEHLATPNPPLLRWGAPGNVSSKDPSTSRKCEPLPQLGGTTCPPSSILQVVGKKFLQDLHIPV
ncbi:hypothetical protein Trydic_g23381 [Trypoxylus dichotomus]